MTAYAPHLEQRAPPRLVFRMWHPLTLVYLGAGIYTLAFPYVSDTVRFALAGAIGVVLIAVAVVPRVSADSIAVDFRKVYFAVMIVGALVTYLVIMPRGTGFGDYASTMVRTLTPMAAIIFFSLGGATVSSRVALFVYAAIAASAVVHTGLYGFVDYAGTPRPYPFTGIEGFHSSAYVVMAALVGTIILAVRQIIGRATALLVGVPLATLLFAYEVRTAWVMTLVFVLVLCIAAARRRLDARIFLGTAAISLAMIALVVPLFIAFALPAIDFGDFSSGRTDVYLERLSILASRPLPELLFGSGLGTDSFTSSTWWWEQKDSHNDFLHLLIEQGIVGLSTLLLILWGTLRRANTLQAAVIISLIAGSALSNGLLGRPLLAVLFLGTMALVTTGSRAAIERRRAGDGAG